MTEPASFRSLVVPLDLTAASDRALAFAGMLADRGRLRVHLVSTMGRESEEMEEEDLEVRAATFGPDGATVHLAQTRDPVAAVRDVAADLERPLLCLATHGRSALGEKLHGSVTDDLLRGTGLPAVVIGPDGDPAGLIGSRLLVCVDEYALHHAALDAAMAWRAAFAGDVVLLEAVADDLRRGPHPALTPVLEDASEVLGPEDVIVVPNWDPVDAIVDEAAQRPGTVVLLVSRLRRGLERAALGSTTWEVIRRYDGPVLVVPAPHDGQHDERQEATS